ncbi:protein RALF-like 19 [Abrus precatorius]|uniref:Protein RALF-like 19 n=1 Tax=Abrus precatorius TaxID=3816 RepID=A0A8B8K6L5_ABRPR|nr:protein RALF-like 19 [Abrus precatorius]
MNSKGWVVFHLLALALAMVAEASELHDFIHVVNEGDTVLLVDDNEFLMSSESHRRTLYVNRRIRYISYEALKANQVPCLRHGRSYYSCHQRGKANPYRRGCSVITHCARDTS